MYKYTVLLGNLDKKIRYKKIADTIGFRCIRQFNLHSRIKIES